MSFRKKIASLVLLSLPCVGMAHAVNSIWTGTSGNWSTPGDWSTNPTIPHLAGDTATFGTSSAVNVITVDITPTIASLTFDNGSYILAPTAGHQLLFDTNPSGGTASINVTTGGQAFQATAGFGTFLAPQTDMTINVTGAHSLLTFESILTSSNNLSFTGGTVNIVNASPISTIVQSAGLNVPNSTITNTNVSLINSANNTNGGSISHYDSVLSLTLDSGSLNLENTGSLLSPSSTIVNFVQVQKGTFTINAGQVNLVNSSTAPITNTSSNNQTGNLINALSTIMNGGTVTLTNNATIESTSIGSSFGSQIETVNLTLNGGTISLNNTGAIQSTGGAIGTSMIVNDTITMNGGMITNSNSGTATGPNAFGSLIASSAINQNNGVFVNDANVQTPALVIGSGALYSGIGVTAPFPPVSPTLLVTNSGTVSPVDINGNPGIMTIEGDYTQTSSGTFSALIQDTSTYSQLDITGTATLAGTLKVAQGAGTKLSSGDKFFILNAPTVLGTFTNIINENIPISLQPQVLFNSNSVELTFLQILFTPITEKYVKLAQPLFSSLNETNTRLYREMERLRGHFAKPAKQKPISTKLSNQDLPLQLVAYEEHQQVETKEKSQRLTESLETVQERPWNFYVGPKGQIGNVYSRDDAQGYKEWSAGAFTGADYAFSQVGVGLLAEYERITGHAGKNWGKFDIDHLHADAYATYAPSRLPELALNGIIGGGYEWYTIHRNFFDANSGTVKGSPRGAELDALLGIEYAFRDSMYSVIPDGFQVIPMASIQYAYLHIDDFKEKGNSMHVMKVERQNVKSLRTDLGVRFNYTWKTTSVEFSPAVNFNWQREFLDKEYTLDFTPLNFQEFGFSVELPRSGRNIALAGVDLLVTLYDRHGLEAGYDFEYNSMYHTHFLYMSYNVRF